MPRIKIGKEPIITIGGRVIKASTTIMVGDNKIEPITSFKFDVNMDKENRITLLEETKKLIPDDLNPEQTETLSKQIIEAFELEGFLKHTDYSEALNREK